MTQLVEGTFQGWPSWTLRQNDCALSVVPGVGGRLMGIQCAGTELCFINPELVGLHGSEDPEIWQCLCGDWSFPLWGGGKTWVAPASAWPGGNPQVDLDSGSYCLTKTWVDKASAGIELESPICRQSSLRIRRRLWLTAGVSGWNVEHTLINEGNEPVRCGLWDVLMLRRPGVVEVALVARGVRPRAEGFCAIAGNGELEDLRRREIIAADRDKVTIRCQHAQQYKVGIAGVTGSIKIELKLPEGRFEYWRTVPIAALEPYAHGHPVEVFNAPRHPYFEIESHSPLATIPPGGRSSYHVREGVRAL